MKKFSVDSARVAVIGLGYVGLPLAVEFGKGRSVLGFDVDERRIESLRQGHDVTLEVSKKELSEADGLRYSSIMADLDACNVYIVTVPTPIDKHKRPDLTPLTRASETIGNVLKKGDIVIYESTVYPGATEDDCVPVLERVSRLTFNEDFFVGYSPERINPGDKLHRLTDILKVTSGSTPEVARFVDALYGSIITAGTHMAPSIRVAEAAKVIENTQRDLNIALVNELAVIFNRMEIDTEAVLQAAGTKWNFLPFRPGLVGGHCIGVDPYYLTHKSESLGYHPQIILAGRRMNDGMAAYVAEQLVKALLNARIHVRAAKVLILGLAFKENCPDIRNTKVVDLIGELRTYGVDVDVYDPWVDATEALDHCDVSVRSELINNSYDAIIIAVPHDQFKKMGGARIRELGRENHVLYDVKHMLPADQADLRL